MNTFIRLKQSILFLVSLLLTALLGCKPNETTPALGLEAGLYKVTIFYPNAEGKTFNMDYYEKTHMPMVAGFLGDNLRLYEIDKGISGRAAGDSVPFLAIGYFYIQDTAQYNAAIAQHRQQIVDDFKNYTNILPIVQISLLRKLAASTSK